MTQSGAKYQGRALVTERIHKFENGEMGVKKKTIINYSTQRYLNNFVKRAPKDLGITP